MIEVVLPYHLRNLAKIDGEVSLDCGGEKSGVTLGEALDALEARYPVLAGTIRDHVTKRRRPFVRFFVCGEDFSNEPQEAFLPDAVVSGKEPLLIIGAIAGG